MHINRIVDGFYFARAVGHRFGVLFQRRLLMVLIVVHDRSPSGGPALGEGESVIASNASISIAFGGADPAGVGSLHVTTEYVMRLW